MIILFQPKSKWVVSEEPDDSEDPDKISTYLADPIIKPSAIKEAGGIINYWDRAKQHRPRVSKMGLDFCSAPGECNWFYLPSL